MKTKKQSRTNAGQTPDKCRPILLGSTVILLLFLTSCSVTRTTIGAGPIGKQKDSELYSRQRQGYLFRGIVPLGFTQAKTPSDGNYQIKTSVRPLDVVLSVLTFGVYTQQTIDVLVKPGGKK